MAQTWHSHRRATVRKQHRVCHVCQSCVISGHRRNQAEVMAEARQAAAGGGGEAATRHKPEYLRKEVTKAAQVNCLALKLSKCSEAFHFIMPPPSAACCMAREVGQLMQLSAPCAVGASAKSFRRMAWCTGGVEQHKALSCPNFECLAAPLWRSGCPEAGQRATLHRGPSRRGRGHRCSGVSCRSSAAAAKAPDWRQQGCTATRGSAPAANCC